MPVRSRSVRIEIRDRTDADASALAFGPGEYFTLRCS